MDRFSRLRALVAVLLLGLATASWTGVGVQAQEATPEAGTFTEGGVTFEPVAMATALALPSTGELFVSRISFEPGAGFPIEAGDPSYALAIMESGELTFVQDLPVIVTRAGAFGAAIAEEEAGGEFALETEEVAAGQEVTVQAGDAVLFPPNAAGEVRNDGAEPAVALVVFVGPPIPEGTPAP